MDTNIQSCCFLIHGRNIKKIFNMKRTLKQRQLCTVLDLHKWCSASTKILRKYKIDPHCSNRMNFVHLQTMIVKQKMHISHTSRTLWLQLFRFIFWNYWIEIKISETTELNWHKGKERKAGEHDLSVSSPPEKQQG